MDSFPRSLNPNKHLREQFVSNLPGSSMLEVFALLNSVALLVLLRFTFCSQAVNDVSRNLKSYLASLALDYVFVVLPSLLIFTVLAEWLYECTIGLFVLLIFSNVVKRTYCLPYLEGPNVVRASISSYRIVTMLVTVLCILAVDFGIYPREFAKTETYGTGLMDLGVGSFVIMNALTSRQARNISSSMSRWKAAFRSTTPLLLLGFARLVSTLVLDYQGYGYHKQKQGGNS
ncbi:GPI-anchored wall transfer protein [Hibiscus syriacus]|uniref:GPI-anchored wall transfer protein n=1 Tax=Hibiscus syriacus TaxID=106335 RepID=A0A6A2ZDZ5_HIBSY|nr:GPI-anchored wall transfer protein [Hibiscus syriacus]